VVVTGCAKQESDVFPGYAEAEYVRLTAPIAGTLTKLSLRRGDSAPANAPAFVLEQASEVAARQEAEFRIERAKAQLADLQKGKRPDELAAARAQLAQANAALMQATADFERDQKLVTAKFISPQRLDATKSAMQQARGKVDELQAQLRVAQTGARADEIVAAQKEVNAAQAAYAQAGWKVDQKTQSTPVAGRRDRRPLPRRRIRAGRQPRGHAAAAGQHQGAVFHSRNEARVDPARPAGDDPVRRLRRADQRRDQLHRARSGIHVADHLQQGEPRDAGVHGRGEAGPGRGATPASGPAARIAPCHFSGASQMTRASKRWAELKADKLQ
jgi:multidrug efflux pump subunit AcrA (membrane-fusion protein)